HHRVGTVRPGGADGFQDLPGLEDGVAAGVEHLTPYAQAGRGAFRHGRLLALVVVGAGDQGQHDVQLLHGGSVSMSRGARRRRSVARSQAPRGVADHAGADDEAVGAPSAAAVLRESAKIPKPRPVRPTAAGGGRGGGGRGPQAEPYRGTVPQRPSTTLQYKQA